MYEKEVAEKKKFLCTKKNCFSFFKMVFRTEKQTISESAQSKSVPVCKKTQRGKKGLVKRGKRNVDAELLFFFY